MNKDKIDWNPETYARFRGFRLRPAIDLLAQVGELPDGDIVDLGCGNGAVGPALAARFSGRRLVGVDSSPAMLAEAEATGCYSEVVQADANVWQPARAPALIFSNALCHWLPDHGALFQRLAECLTAGGTLAVQMPRQFAAPSHALLRSVAAEMFPDVFDLTGWQAPVEAPEIYARLLEGLGEVSVWETEYVQRLAPEVEGHPVRHFTMSTAMRPYLDKLDAAQATDYTAAYESALDMAYPVSSDGSLFFPFRRVFFVVSI